VIFAGDEHDKEPAADAAHDAELDDDPDLDEECTGWHE